MKRKIAWAILIMTSVIVVGILAGGIILCLINNPETILPFIAFGLIFRTIFWAIDVVSTPPPKDDE